METIIFDVDDVLVNDAFFGVVQEFCKTQLNREVTKDDVGKEYYYEKAIFNDDNETIQKFYDYFLTKDMYDYGILERGAVQLMEKLSRNYNVVIMTCATLKGREKESGILFKNKFDMLCKTFPFLEPGNFVIGANKSILSADYMVDDRVDNLSGNVKVKMLYTAKHNEDISDIELYRKGIIRVSSMDEVEKIVNGAINVKDFYTLLEKYAKYMANDDCLEIYKIETQMRSDEEDKIVTEVTVMIEDEVEDSDKIHFYEDFCSNLFKVKVEVIDNYDI